MIDILNHLRMDIPTIAETNITFYGTLGYIMFMLVNTTALTGGLLMLKLLIEKLKAQKK